MIELMDADYIPMYPAMFSCEEHEEPGHCSRECFELMSLMYEAVNFDPNYPTYDPYRVHEPPPRPFESVEFDDEHHAVLVVTYVPTYGI